MFVAFLGEENINFWCSIFLTIQTIGVIVLWLCVKKYLNVIKHKPHPDCQLAFGFNSNFPTSILVLFSYDSLGVFPWMDFNTIRTRYSPRHRCKYWLSIQKEYLVISEQITIKSDRLFYLQWALVVDKLASQRIWKNPFCYSFSMTCRLHLTLFIQEYMCGPRGVRQILINLQSGGLHFYFIFIPGLVAFLFLNCLNPHVSVFR